MFIKLLRPEGLEDVYIDIEEIMAVTSGTLGVEGTVYTKSGYKWHMEERPELFLARIHSTVIREGDTIRLR